MKRRTCYLQAQQVAQLLELARMLLLAHRLQRLDELVQKVQRLLVLISRNVLQVLLLKYEVQQLVETSRVHTDEEVYSG